jgi:hypothetical protein
VSLYLTASLPVRRTGDLAAWSCDLLSPFDQGIIYDDCHSGFTMIAIHNDCLTTGEVFVVPGFAL